jgi:cell division protein ZapD
LIIDILHLLERPDLKAKLAKELSHQIQLLGRLEKTPEIDHVKLNKLLKQLDELNHWLIESNGRLGQSLREIELLNTLRLHLATPGGGCNFDIPTYHFWLQQPHETRLETLKSWLTEFNRIRLINDLILKLVREESKTHQKNASNGFHQELLDPQTNLRLIRVMVPNIIDAYPEISLGRHFLSIRFYTPTILERAAQHQHNLSFWLSYCTS